MDSTIFILTGTAVISAIFYMFYVIMKDSLKPEPWPMLIAAAVVGIVAALAVCLTGWGRPIEGLQVLEAHSLTESLFIGFLGLAIPAEVVKWIALFIFLSLNKYYDEYLDGMVYAVCLAMGFAGVWSIWFMTSSSDLSSLAMVVQCLFIIFILVPIHLAASSQMGYFFALARRRHKIRNLLLALLLPILINGLLCTLLLALGNRGAYYFILGILYPILSMAFHTQLFRLLKMDRGEKG